MRPGLYARLAALEDPARSDRTAAARHRRPWASASPEGRAPYLAPTLTAEAPTRLPPLALELAQSCPHDVAPCADPNQPALGHDRKVLDLLLEQGLPVRK